MSEQESIKINKSGDFTAKSRNAKMKAGAKLRRKTDASSMNLFANIRKQTNYWLRLAERMPEKVLTRAYIIALGLIAVLTVASHMITAHITVLQKEDGQIAYDISRQRALMQKTMLDASSYLATGAELDKQFLMQSIQELEIVYSELRMNTLGSGDRSRSESPVLYQIYFNQPLNVDQRIQAFLNTARDFISIPANGLTNEERQSTFNKMSDDNFNFLIRALDSALESYRVETVKKVEFYHHMQLWSVIFVLSVLIFEAFVIFRPLVKRVSNSHRLLTRYALEDHLTGLHNRRAFIKRASDELKRANRDNSPFAVILTDLDKFKSVNDTYGHNVGDLVLKHFSKIVKKSLRAGDIVGRIGGEEFAMLLPRTDAEKAYQTIERLRKNIASTPCEYKDDNEKWQSLDFTASFGLVHATGGNWNIDNLLTQADIYLYKAKEGGRNKVVQHEATVDPTHDQ